MTLSLTTPGMIKSAFATKKGILNDVNQDRCIITGNGAVICDGVGGAIAGGIMAEVASWSVSEQLKRKESDPKLILTEANSVIGKQKKLLSEIMPDMVDTFDLQISGTSTCVLIFEKDGCRIGTCGDIAVFLVNEESVIELTGMRKINTVTSHLEGTKSVWFYTQIPIEKMRNASIVALTDGIWKYVPEAEIGRVARGKSGSTGEVADELVYLACEFSSPDDKTALVCRL